MKVREERERKEPGGEWEWVRRESKGKRNEGKAAEHRKRKGEKETSEETGRKVGGWGRDERERESSQKEGTGEDIGKEKGSKDCFMGGLS